MKMSLFDFSIKSRVAESRINEKLKNTDAIAAENDLKMEVIKSFSNIWLMEEQLRSTELDTLRTSRTKELITARFKEVKYDLLADEIDLQKEMSKFSEISAELVRKKIELIHNSGAISILLNNLKQN
jgi:outer membrane protein